MIDESTEFPRYIAISILLYMSARYIIEVYIRINVSLPTKKFFIRFDVSNLIPKSIINTPSYFHRAFIVSNGEWTNTSISLWVLWFHE